jgi:PAS domain S-box-containing protein
MESVMAGDARSSAKARRAARLAAARFQALIDASAQIVWTTDAHGKVVEDSVSWRAFTGQTYEQWTGPNAVDAIHPDDRGAAIAAWEVAIAGRQPFVAEYRVRHVSGEWRWASVRAVPLMGPDGSVKEWVGMNTDITVHKRVASEYQLMAEVSGVLASSTLDLEQKLKSVAALAVRDLADLCIVDLVHDCESRRVAVVHCDPAQEALCRELAAIPFGSRTLIRPAVVTREAQLVREVTDEFVHATAQSAEHERLVRRIGPRSFLVVPLSSHGEVRGALTLVSSQPWRRYGPRDLAFAQELASRAALALENARLYERAVQEARSREWMNAVVSHDLKNPLLAIRLSAELMQRRPDVEHLERIKRTADEMLRLIQRLLDASSMEAGQLTIDRRPTSARALARDTVAAFEAMAGQRAITLAQHVPDEDFAIVCDRDRVLQALANLLGNACKFTEAGGVMLRIDRSEREATFAVMDTGSGMPAEQLPHVFDRYWQAEPMEKLGAGLGLSITKGIVEAHGGRVWVESELGVGSTFYFTLPLS